MKDEGNVDGARVRASRHGTAPPPQDPTVGLCPGPYDGPRVVGGQFLVSEVAL